MFEKDVVALEINEENITILIGHKYDIREGATFKTPVGSVKSDNILNLDQILDVVEPYVSKRKKSAKEIMFSIRGQDVIIRHLTVPNTDEKLMRDNVYFELKQFIGDKIEEYYNDFEVISLNAAGTDAHVMVVGVKKGKVEMYLQLAEELGLELKAIDVFSNCIGRVFRNFKPSVGHNTKLVGSISIDSYSNSMIITDDGKIVIEKYQGYGLMGAHEKDIENDHEYNKFLDSMILSSKENEVIEEKKYHRFFKSLVTQYKMLVQFYSTGKVKKNLDKIYLLGSANRIEGIHEYLEKNFEVKVGEVPDFNELKNVVKNPNNLKLKDYLYTYGLFLRKE